MSFDIAAVKAGGGDWEDAVRCDAVVERLRSLRLRSISVEDNSDRSKVILLTQGIAQMLLYRIVALADGCTRAWNQRDSISAVLDARALLETASVLCDLAKQLDRLTREGNFQAIYDLIGKRSLATRDPEWLRLHPDVQSVSILTLMDKMQKDYEGVREVYDHLSDISHPNWIGHFGIFAKLDVETNTLTFSEPDPSEVFAAVLAAYGFVHDVEGRLNDIDTLLPRISELASRPGPRPNS